jgi:prophage antirepressor-like protein
VYSYYVAERGLPPQVGEILQEGESMKDTDLITFTNDSIGEIRGLMKDGEPWFLSGQVCRCLGIKNANETISRIKARHEKYGDKGVGIAYTLFDTAGGKQKLAIISESVLYELIFRSEKKKAFQFQQWVFTEVLPSIRKYGEYRMSGKLIRRTLTDEIVESGEHERMHGHGITNYSKLINKSLGLPSKANRDTFTAEQLEAVAHRENLVKALLAEGKTYLFIKEVIENIGGGCVFENTLTGETVKIPQAPKEAGK